MKRSTHQRDPGLTALRAFLALFGTVCAAIGMLHVILGSAAIPGSIAVNPTMDSEDRFYAVLFVGFGAALLWCSRNPLQRRGTLAFLMLTFLGGGIGRVVSWLAVGPPSALFIFLGGLEFIIPPVIWFWLSRVD